MERFAPGVMINVNLFVEFSNFINVFDWLSVRNPSEIIFNGLRILNVFHRLSRQLTSVSPLFSVEVESYHSGAC